MGAPMWDVGQESLPAGLARQVAGVKQGLSRGLKFLIVAGLALLMSLLALFVEWITEDRTTRAASVRHELSSEAGGTQEFLGPVVLVPYTQADVDPVKPVRHGVLAITASTGNAQVVVHAEERRRSLYRVPVFESEVLLESSFSATDLQIALPQGAVPDWSGAALAVAVSNVRAALSDGVLETQEGSMALQPLAVQHEIAITTPAGTQANSAAQAHSLEVLGVAASRLKESGPFKVRARLRFSGAERATVLPYAQATTVTMRGNWASPGFDGGVLPTHRAITAQGFTADWYVSSLARGLPPVQDVALMQTLGDTAMTTRLVEVADAYQSVERSLKYAPLFLGLVFLSYFLFEVTSGRAMHVAQYALVGVAQLVFYLLLLSFAERIGFDWGFALGSAATVSLLSLNAGWVFRSARQRWRAAAIFGALYAMIYGLLRMEDNALLLGALGSFAAVATAMFVTREMDWYGAGVAGAPSNATTAEVR